MAYKKGIHFSIWVLVASLYATHMYSLYHSVWAAYDYTHAYLILPLFLWLVWRKRVVLRESMKRIEQGSNIFGLFILLFGISLFIFGWRRNFVSVTTASLLPVLYGLVNYLYGAGVTRILAFPILYLIFLVPLPAGIVDSITLPMRYGVSIATAGILEFLRYPITREGLLLSIGSDELFMGQPCSGFRSLISLFSLALIYVYLSRINLQKKALMVSFIIPFALLGNLIRVLLLCIITYYFGMDAGQGFFHNFSGMVIFIIIVAGLFGMECLLRRNYACKLNHG